MPEIVEVCLTAEFMNTYFVNKVITSINIHGGRYLKKDPVGYNIIQNHLPLKITKIDSKGKFLWFELIDNNQNEFYILNTFGLEGMWGTKQEKHSHIQLKINTKLSLWFTDMRNFGTIKFSNTNDDLIEKLTELGPDLLKTSFTDDEFIVRVNNICSKAKNKNAQKLKIVRVLMDQTTNGIGSGIGNYLAPEILYRAKISPHTNICDLTKDQLHILSFNIKYTIKLSYETGKIGYIKKMDKSVEKLPRNNYHPDIKINKDDVFEFKVYRQKTDPHNNKVKADKIINERTTYWVPNVQTI